MSLLQRLCKSSAPKPSCSSHPDSLHQAVEQLKAALEEREAQAQRALNTPRLPPHTGSAAAGILGAAALTGLALYLSRAPRIPDGVHPVHHFNLQRYLGKWYELARIEHSFERGLQRTQAEYSLAPNGSILVTNRGYDPKHNTWKVSHGKAKTTIAPDIAALKVSFFGPFYGGYNVVALDDNYQWAMVIGSSLDYFWILSRTPSLPEGISERLLHQAELIGVDAQRVLWVHQDGVNPTGSY